MKKIIIDVIIRFNKDDVPGLGSQVAYKLILGFFPFLIFLMNVMGYTFLNSVQVITNLTSIFPHSVSNLIRDTISEMATFKNGSLMSLSLLLTLWSASSGFDAVIKGLNKAYGVKEGRSYVKRRLVSILCTLGMCFVIIIMVVLLVLGGVLWKAIEYRFPIFNKLLVLWLIIKYLIVVFTTIFIFAALYYYAPDRRLRWSEVYPGSIFSTFSLIIVSGAFAFYVNNFSRYSIIYGSIGAIIVLLIWLFLVSVIIILGGEVNASIASQNTITKKHSIKASSSL